MKDDIVQAALERLYQMQCDMLSDIETVASALEQPKQEPVAWPVELKPVFYAPRRLSNKEVMAIIDPPRREWRSLSEEEICQIALDMPIDGTNFARAIEAALKERNA